MSMAFSALFFFILLYDPLYAPKGLPGKKEEWEVKGDQTNIT